MIIFPLVLEGLATGSFILLHQTEILSQGALELRTRKNVAANSLP